MVGDANGRRSMLVYSDGKVRYEEVPLGALKVIAPETVRTASAADLEDIGLMGRIRNRTFVRNCDRRAPFGGNVYEEASLSEPIEVRRSWVL